MTEKEAREALLFRVKHLSHDLAIVNNAIGALLAARTEVIAAKVKGAADTMEEFSEPLGLDVTSAVECVRNIAGLIRAEKWNP